MFSEVIFDDEWAFGAFSIQWKFTYIVCSSASRLPACRSVHSEWRGGLMVPRSRSGGRRRILYWREGCERTLTTGLDAVFFARDLPVPIYVVCLPSEAGTIMPPVV